MLAVGELIHQPLSVIMDMSIEEFHLWLGWMRLKHDAEKKAMAKSKR